MGKTALISIIIPCYNSASTISKCLTSVISQSYQNLEIIVVDDGSTDNTLEILKNFEETDSRIIIINQKNSGVSKARNVGVEIASGEYICFVDSDDWVEKEYCSLLYEIIVENNADISIAGAFLENGDIKYNNKAQVFDDSLEIYDKQTALKYLLEDKVIQSQPWAKLYKSHLLKNTSFPENLEAFEDYFIMFRIFNSSEKIVKISKQIYHYVQFADSLSHNLTPKRAYHFFLALIEASKFLETVNMDSDFRNAVIRNIIKKSFMVLKRIIRNTGSNEMVSEKEDIRKSMVVFLQYSPFKIGLENYLYLRFFINFYEKYIRFIKL
ncbi:glycosyltransferase family 2 protein [Chryseobacterium sp. SNU WT5]|uniref:glycosyltransferase family 2 protein n=1 Tax=Chryseobacterium sp. SNU WT5 TaxID=2594269 RepID=UPI00117F18E8|nr:glycosyltransferase family 2 protein [Chryseobacterium sp. SNU WT5]QDP84655.1 glycosyltransferase family 2 protein [Chryseobacterium sp. SNU WT5]